MSKQVSFDIFAMILYSIAANAKLAASDVKWIISLTSAFLASILACLSSQPGDMILTATYKNKSGGGMNAIIRDIYQKHGLGGFFIGVQARMAHVISIITSQLVLYDIIKTALKLPASGSH
jgi:solute carrier family 25 (mitochondrial phosphate transporter), member 3